VGQGDQQRDMAQILLLGSRHHRMSGCCILASMQEAEAYEKPSRVATAYQGPTTHLPGWAGTLAAPA
jgi:hypothetical protein